MAELAAALRELARLQGDAARMAAAAEAVSLDRERFARETDALRAELADARGAADAVEPQLHHLGVRLPRRDGRDEETDDGADGRDDVGEVVRKG